MTSLSNLILQVDVENNFQKDGMITLEEHMQVTHQTLRKRVP